MDDEEDNWKPQEGQKYTKDKESHGRRDCGWSTQGKLRFNELMTKVAQDRTTNAKVEDIFRCEMEEHNRNQRPGKRKCIRQEEHIEMLTSKEVMERVAEVNSR
jgi:hypothetical protein